MNETIEEFKLDESGMCNFCLEWNKKKSTYLNFTKEEESIPDRFCCSSQQLGPGQRCSGWWLKGQLNRKDRLRSLPLFRPPSFDNFYGDLQILAKKVAKKRPPSGLNKDSHIQHIGGASLLKG